MEEYVFNSPMIDIHMGGVDVLLGIQWLQWLGIRALNFQVLFMRFSLEGKEFEQRGTEQKPCKVIISNGIAIFFYKGQQVLIA